jgi:hypothetical protein
MGMWGPLLDLMANRMICLLPKIKSKQMVSKPQKTMMISVTPDSWAILTILLLYLEAKETKIISWSNKQYLVNCLYF